MSYHIENDKNAENFEGHRGRGLDWTLYEGDLVHEFFETREDAVTASQSIRDNLRDRIEHLRNELEEAEFDLEELQDLA